MSNKSQIPIFNHVCGVLLDISAENILKFSFAYKHIWKAERTHDKMISMWRNMNVVGDMLDYESYSENQKNQILRTDRDMTSVPREIAELAKVKDIHSYFADRRRFGALEKWILDLQSSPNFGDADDYIVYSNAGELGSVSSKRPTYYKELVTFDVAVALKRIRHYFYDRAMDCEMRATDEMPDEELLISFDETVEVFISIFDSFCPGGFKLTEEEKAELSERLVSSKEALCDAVGRISYKVFREWFISVVDGITTVRGRDLKRRQVQSSIHDDNTSYEISATPVTTEIDPQDTLDWLTVCTVGPFLSNQKVDISFSERKD
jgi:hypothetical protein